MTDCDLILKVLEDGKWHHVQQIMRKAKPGAINWACRSRIADLKKKGITIESRLAADGQAEYRLVSDVYRNTIACTLRSMVADFGKLVVTLINKE